MLNNSHFALSALPFSAPPVAPTEALTRSDCRVLLCVLSNTLLIKSHSGES